MRYSHIFHSAKSAAHLNVAAFPRARRFCSARAGRRAHAARTQLRMMPSCATACERWWRPFALGSTHRRLRHHVAEYARFAARATLNLVFHRQRRIARAAGHEAERIDLPRPSLCEHALQST
eukprot:IDg20870t1